MTDNIKLTFTYTIATILIVGGLWFLYATRLDPSTSNTPALVPLVSAYIGAAVGFVFQNETQTRTARQIERSYAAAAANTPTTTVTAGPPATATVTPAVSSNGATEPDPNV